MTAPRTTAADTFRWLRTNGFDPIEILPRSKHPNNGEGWSQDSYVASAYYFDQDDANVGARLGRGGLRDIDLDCPEALWYAARILPATEAIFGRPGAPRSHYLYRLPEAYPRKFALIDPIIQSANKGKPKADQEKASIIDLRGINQYTVMPGSIHMDTHEDIQWATNPSPSVASPEPEDLERAVYLVAMCILIERHFWLEGMRHDVCRMLSGVFYFLEFDLDTAELVLGLVMERTEDDDPSRLKTLRMTYRKADEGKKTEGATKLRAFLPAASPCVDKFFEWFGGEKYDIIDAYNDRYAVVRYGSDIRIAVFDEDEPVEFLRKQAFFDFTATDILQFPDPDTGKLVKVPKSKMWWADAKRAQYSGITFAPGVSGDDPSLRGKLNLWRGWGCKPADKTWEEAEYGCKMWLEHLYRVICNEDKDLYNWTINWFADIVRNPGRKPGTALAMRGGQGAGKTSVFQYFGKILGHAYVRISQPSQLTGNFNAHMQQALLLHAEEAVFTKSPTTMNILKDMITSDTLALEKKGNDIVTVASYMRMAFTSNSDHVISPERDDRRYTMVELAKRQRDRSRKKDYDAERDGDGPSCLFRYLLDCPHIGHVDVEENFVTADLALQKHQTFDPIETWWYQILNRGVLLHPLVNWCQRPQHEAWPVSVSSTALFACYRHWNGMQRFRLDSNEVVFFSKLRQMMDDSPRLDAKKKRRLTYVSPDEWPNPGTPREMTELGTLQSSFEYFPSLEECRKAFVAYAKLTDDHEWDDAALPFEREVSPKPVPTPEGAQEF